MRPPARSLLFGVLLAAVFWLIHHGSIGLFRLVLLLQDSLAPWWISGSLVAGFAAWWLIVERRRPMTRWNGTSAGAAAGALIVVAMYVVTTMRDLMGRHGADEMIAFMILMFVPMAAGFGVMVGGSVGFLYHLLACPRPRNSPA